MHLQSSGLLCVIFFLNYTELDNNDYICQLANMK
jgi:hypothetical protein